MGQVPDGVSTKATSIVRDGQPEHRRLEGSLPRPSDMQNFSAANSAVFSMHDLDSDRTPMWKIGHTKLRDHWIPVALPPPLRSRATFSADGRLLIIAGVGR